ncbi:F-box protein AFR-like [Ananas comosus]|uniref:F-box protein AFR-like n=1 Tax=Ananas comosus TaxID=4615 RepID=A0A6P5GN27_ANACO|nr:F-box protein AFR-like [Ananas comosus]
MKPRSETTTEEEAAAAALIPGLPEDVAELCLVRVPFPYQTLARSVSAAWNRALSRPSFLSRARSSSSSSSPFLFVFAFHPVSLRLQCQALDPVSRRWFLLPQIPLPSSPSPSSHGGGGDGAPPPPPPPLHPASCAFASLPSRGELFVLAPRPAALLLAYRAATNSWTPAAAAAAAPGPFLAAGAVAGRILAASGDGAAARYDPEADRWEPAPGLRRGMARYDAAVVAGRRMYVTEGWAWPFDAAPRGAVFDADRDAWAEMPPGMREGWTGASAVVGDDRLFVVAEYGDRRLKSYDAARDSWRGVAGPGVPPDLPRPFAVAGDRSGRIFVVGRGLDVAVATVLPPPARREEEGERWWERGEAPLRLRPPRPATLSVRSIRREEDINSEENKTESLPEKPMGTANGVLDNDLAYHVRSPQARKHTALALTVNVE